MEYMKEWKIKKQKRIVEQEDIHFKKVIKLLYTMDSGQIICFTVMVEEYQPKTTGLDNQNLIKNMDM